MSNKGETPFERMTARAMIRIVGQLQKLAVLMAEVVEKVNKIEETRHCETKQKVEQLQSPSK